MNNKKFLIALLSVLILVFNSCNNDITNPTNPKVSFKVSDIVGPWRSTSSTDTFTISSDGMMSLPISTGTTHVPIVNWNGSQEVLEGDYYELQLEATHQTYGKGYYIFRFTSSSSCSVLFRPLSTSSITDNKEIYTKQ